MTIDDAFVRDDPADLETLDAFAHVNIPGALAHATAPFATGLFGPLGIGKSTVIRALLREARLDDEGLG